MDDLVSTKHWQTLKSIISDFEMFCNDHHIIPIVLYIPSKLEVYDEVIVNNGVDISRKINRFYKYKDQKSNAIESIANDLDIKLINLLPYFKAKTKAGHMLYYAFNTHWNTRGIKFAAEFITLSLERLYDDVQKK